MRQDNIAVQAVEDQCEGRKDDADKWTQPELVAPEFVEGIGAVLAFGRKKYAAGNWSYGMAWSRPFGACLRHLMAWARGERFDPESGLPHLYHAGCCLMFLSTYEERYIGYDDRTEVGLRARPATKTTGTADASQKAYR